MSLFSKNSILCKKTVYFSRKKSDNKENIHTKPQEGELNLNDNIKPIFPVTDELLELVEMINQTSETPNDKVIYQTMTVLNRVYAQGIMEGYQKASERNNEDED